VAETLTNLMWARVTALEDVKCSGNWMWAAKLPGEGARLWDCCVALKDALLDLGVGIDGADPPKQGIPFQLLEQQQQQQQQQQPKTEMHQN
jgi:hypothetical protein